MTIDGATGALYVTAYLANGHWSLWRTRNPTAANENAIVWEKLHEFGDNHWVTLLASGASAQGPAL